MDFLPEVPTHKIDPNKKKETQQLMNAVKQMKKNEVNTHNAAFMGKKRESEEKKNGLHNKTIELRKAELVANRVEQKVNAKYAHTLQPKSMMNRFTSLFSSSKKRPNIGGKRKKNRKTRKHNNQKA